MTGRRVVVLDLADPGAPSALARGVAEHLGDTLGGVVAASGSHGPVGRTRDIDLAALRHSVDENLIGVLGCLQALAPALDRAPAPSVVLLSGGGATTRIHEGTGEEPPANAGPAELIVLLLGPDGAGITGRPISAPWDPWREERGRVMLRGHPSFGRLLRVDGEQIVDPGER